MEDKKENLIEKKERNKSLEEKENLIEKGENQSLKEQAIDESATHGKKINHQINDKREHHQPRDTA